VIKKKFFTTLTTEYGCKCREGFLGDGYSCEGIARARAQWYKKIAELLCKLLCILLC
jgi:hypothetical protein